MIEAALTLRKGDKVVEVTVGALHPYSQDYLVTLGFETAGEGPWYRLTPENARALVLAIQARLDATRSCGKCGRAMAIDSDDWSERCPKDQTGCHRA